MSDKWQPNKRRYMEWVRDYARHFLKCPACGAEPRQYCLVREDYHEPGKMVCRERWNLARDEITDPARKREWPRKQPRTMRERPAEPSHTRREFTGRDETWAARKLREALAEDGVIMRKEGDGYLIVKDGIVRGPMSLGAAIWWASSFWGESCFDAGDKDDQAA